MIDIYDAWGIWYDQFVKKSTYNQLSWYQWQFRVWLAKTDEWWWTKLKWPDVSKKCDIDWNDANQRGVQVNLSFLPITQRVTVILIAHWNRMHNWYVTGNTSNYLEVYGSTWNYLEVPGSTWKYLEVPGSTWKYLEVPRRSGLVWSWSVLNS